MNQIDLEGRCAVVTGGAQGIGYAIAERLLHSGATVSVWDQDAERLEKARADLSAYGAVHAVTVDVTDAPGVQQQAERVQQNLGRVDILVNNAGIYPMIPMLELTREAWQRVIDVNLTGLSFVSKAAGARMAEQGAGGKIINVASIDALHPSMVGLAAYDSSKGGVLMFTKAFALEMAPHGVNVNAIAPGGISTEGTAAPLAGSGLTADEMTAMTERFIAQIPLGRMGEPDDIAKVAVFLASSAADYITGELIVVDGGRLLG